MTEMKVNDVNRHIIHLLSYNCVLGKTIASAMDATSLHTHVFPLWLKMKMLLRVVQRQQLLSPLHIQPSIAK